jgi:mycothiol synthase
LGWWPLRRTGCGEIDSRIGKTVPFPAALLPATVGRGGSGREDDAPAGLRGGVPRAFDVVGRGIGKLIATGLEEDAARRGARRIQSNVFELDAAARGLLESLGYGAVRVFRELRIELEATPPAPQWPDGLRVVPFDAERDALEFHAAHQEAFADHWDYSPRDFESWSKGHLASERFDPALWCVVRAGDEIAAGTICMGDTYGGGWVQVLFTRRPWRRQGVGAALLRDAFGRFWERGERSIGLGVDAANATGAFRLYERAGMAPALGWVMYEKLLGDAA